MIKKVFSIFLVIAVFLSFLLVPVACAPTGEQEEEEDEEEGLILEPGELVTGVDGVTIGAPEGVLDQAIEIFIEKVDDPREEVPFPENMEDMEVVGDFYEISAGQDFSASTGDYLLLGLPVPEEVSTDDLMFVSLVPPDGVVQDWLSDDPSIRWTLLQGVYDPGSGLFGTLLPSVSAGSDIFALLLPCFINRIYEWTDVDPFRVISIGCGDWISTDSHRALTGLALKKALDAYVGMGFNEPDLRHPVKTIDFGSNECEIENLYEYQLREKTPDDPLGVYHPNSRVACTYYKGDPDQPDPITAHHELFHAIQFAYFSVRDNWHSWELRRTLESGAVAAEMSLTGLTRSRDWNPHPVDHGLWSSINVTLWDYRAQDFLVYLCKKAPDLYTGPEQGKGLAWLNLWYLLGGMEDNLDHIIEYDHTLNSLGEAYWEWVKNQAFEKSVILGLDSGNQLVPYGDYCSWSGHGQPPVSVSYSYAGNSWSDAATDFKLPRLTSRVFRLHLPKRASPYEVVAKIYTDDPNIRWKFYEDALIGTKICWLCCDNYECSFKVTDTDVGAYLLVSNTDCGVGDESGSISLIATRPIIFTDPIIDELIRGILAIPDDPIDPSVLENIAELNGSGKGIRDLDGLEYCTNLEVLDLGVNQISDISPLASLTKLERLSLDWNQIDDLYPLASLTSLTMLNLDENQISDLDPLANLTSLTVLGASYNEITDIDPLADLTSLEQLRLYSNQISDVSVIADLGNLDYLDLGSNQISDISPLVDCDGLSEGDQVYLGNNPLSSYSVEIYIPQLEERGVIVDY